MTPHQTAIIARLNQGPADRIDLATVLHTQCAVPPLDMYAAAFHACASLIADGRIAQHVSGCYVLPSSTPIEADGDEVPRSAQKKKARMGPGKWSHLTVHEP